jgi:hypothetical protein
MRTILLFVILISSIAVKAQTLLPVNSMDYTQRGALRNDSILNKKWSFSTYSSISTSFTFFNGGSATIFAAPVGLQLNRRLNNNLYAFAGISVAPAYVNFNRSFLSSDVNKMNQNSSFFRSNRFGMYSRAEMGLMYINDARTFSISGSIGIERSSPIFPYQPGNTARPNSFIPANK